jgi:DNA-binding MarR family transcriptional regulator/N-acetylglutamate synthase-like GNAT family acetyltransferase
MTQSSVAAQRIDSVRAFNRFYTRRIGVLGNGLLDSRYSLTEVRVLYEIAHRDQVMAADLVRDLGLDAGYVSRILTAFDKRGWLRRERCKDDARKTFLSVTALGRRQADEMERRSRKQVSGLLAPLDPERQLKLQGHLQNVQALLAGTKTHAERLTLREHRAGDIGWIIQRHGQIYAGEYGWDSRFEALVAQICAEFLRNFEASGERCWIAERDGVPVGCIMLVRKSRTVAKLRLLLVESSQRGMGVGSALVRQCIEFAKQAGYRTITLWTQRSLTSARRIYEAEGFELVASEPHRQFGMPLVGETWELDLRSKRRTASQDD